MAGINIQGQLISHNAGILSLFHQKILAYELTPKRPAHELRKLNQSLASSTVDLPPHQIDMGDVQYVWENFKEFKALFRCQQCYRSLTYVHGDKKPYCKKCGEWPMK